MFEPLVIGAIGQYDHEVVERMTLGADVATVIRNDHVWLLSDAPLVPWEASGHMGYLWGRLDRSITPTSLATARESAGGVGIIVSRDEVILHGDHLGLWPVHRIAPEGVVYFSNRLSPVLAVCRAPTLDRVAWAALLSLRHAPPGRSLVSEVSTLRHGEIVTFSRDRRVATSLIDQPTMSPSRATDEDLIEAVGAVIEACGESDLLLSGGFDSRLLLACGVAADARLECLTTSSSAEEDRDQRPAAAVARAVGRPIIEVVRHTEWFDAFVQTSGRMDFATSLHAWAFDVSSVARQRGRGVIAGMGGGLLVNDHLQDTAVDRRGSDRDTRIVLLDRLGADTLRQDGPLDISMLAFREWIVDDFLETTAAYADRPDWQAIAILTTRTARSIASFPLRLCGPEVPATLPYLAPRVLNACLAAASHARRGDQRHRELLDQLNPVLASLPISRQAAPRVGPTPAPQRTVRTLERTISTIAGDEVALSVLDPIIRRPIVDRDLDEVSRAMSYTHVERVIHGALLLAVFRVAHPEVGGFSP